MKGEEPFAFAGLWDEWRGDKLPISSCAIITTTANQLLAPIHDRMPVILHPTVYDDWLSGDAKLVNLKSLLLPYPASEMKSHPVGNDVNHAKVDHPHLVTRVDEILDPNLSLF